MMLQSMRLHTRSFLSGNYLSPREQRSWFLLLETQESGHGEENPGRR